MLEEFWGNTIMTTFKRQDGIPLLLEKKVFFKTQAEAADSNSLSKVSEKPPKEDNSDQQLNCAKVKRSLRCAHKI